MTYNTDNMTKNIFTKTLPNGHTVMRDRVFYPLAAITAPFWGSAVLIATFIGIIH
jgi:hypothetical protein